jgi:Ca-activated chloride channel family protein
MGGVTLAPQRSLGAPHERRRYLLCAGIALAIVALARPQWGRLDEPIFDQSRDIVIALDLSRSMLTPDVRPTRLERAKLLVDSLLDKLKGERVGLIIFSGTAFLQSPVSSDYEILREFLPSMNPDYMPEGGTNYSQLIDTAVDAFSGESAADRYLIILSDGEATDEGWRGKIPALTERGIKVIGLGVGTRSGGMIPDGSGSFMKDQNGAVVLSKLESGTLEALAKATNGTYRDASQWVDISKLIESTVDKGRRGRFVEHNSVRYAERFQWALAQALACLVASFWLEFPVEPKSRSIRLSRPAAAKAVAAVAAALLALLLPRRALGAEQPAREESAKLLSKVVGRLASQDNRSAADWAEMSSDTVSWGQDVKSGGKPVPEQPVRDALRAVGEGERKDAKAADWPKLRSELEALLKVPPQKKQDQKDQDKKDQKSQGQSNKDKDKDKDEDRQNKGQQGDQKQQQQQNQSGQQGDQKENKAQQQGQQDHDRAFGNMGKPQTAPKAQAPQSAMKKVGGPKPEKGDDPARNDPELAVPLEKLEQLKNQDSPGQLFEMIRSGEPTPTPQDNGGKNW